MKKVKFITLFIILFVMGIMNVKAESSQSTRNEIPCTCSYKHYSDFSIPRSILVPLTVYGTQSYIIMDEAQETESANIVITDNNGIVVKNETITVSPNQEATIYIGDLESGTYDLTVELEDYTLYGSFDIE